MRFTAQGNGFHAAKNEFRAAGVVLLRAARVEPNVPPCPELDGSGPGRVAGWVDWLRAVWAAEDVAEALEHASPVLAAKVGSLCAVREPDVRETRRAVLSVVRYLLRMTGRSTPFGLFAGVAVAGFGTTPGQCWGTEHRAVARAAAEWLTEVIARVEGCPEVLAGLPVIANTTQVVRGSRLIVPYQPRSLARGTAAVEVSLRYTAAVRAAVEAAQEPIRFDDLSGKIQSSFPAVPALTVTTMLTELVRRGALITNLRAPSTEPDALGHLVTQLAATDAAAAPAAGLIAALTEIRALMEQHNLAPVGAGGALRTELSSRMRQLAPARKHPLAVDLRLDVTTVLPVEVGLEVERATAVLTRLSAHPTGAPAWRDYHQRFYERFGRGALVPVLEVVADSGIGWPDGYPGTVRPEPRSPWSGRDETLLSLAQGAAFDGRDEVVLDESLIAALELRPGRHRPPPHLEVGVRVDATDQQALARGDFRLEIVTVSRAAGVVTGRFLPVLGAEDRQQLAASLAALPGGDRDTVAAQLSFPPLDPATAHVTRTPRTLPTVISLAEHRRPGEEGVLTVRDLAVGCDGQRMYLAVPALGRRVEAAGMHALNLLTHTPPLARFLTELGRAQSAQVTAFDWGAAARLPFLPRVRYGRTILSPARWRLDAADLPARSTALPVWDKALSGWQARRRVPRRVHLVDGDRLLPLDLDQVGHRVLLRTHLDGAPQAVLTEAPDPAQAGWCGGHPHEVIVPLTATEPPAWPPLPAPTRARVVRRGHGQAPAASRVLLAGLYGDLHRQDTVLVEYLPDLLARLDQPPWWYIRYRDPDHHLRLRIALPDPDQYGATAHVVSTWAEELHQAGLLREVRYTTSYPETGRWGSGPAWAAAEDVFRADSRALLTQLGLTARPHHHALAAAHAIAITTAFTGDATTGTRWLLDHVPAPAPARVPRVIFTQAVRLADPTADWAALRGAPGGAAIADAWAPREAALAAYRAHLPGPHTRGVAADDALGSLLHVNFVRASGIDFDDEATALYLARAAALAWTARSAGRHP